MEKSLAPKNQVNARQKALLINQDETIYGTLAEIGAGQEVARYFFQAGLASQTVAKTMSAYDMVFSDKIYGRESSGRYVVESRLKKMLDHEYSLVIERLQNERKKETKYFAFANTMATGNVDQPGHGWLGLRFQDSVGAEPSQVVIHIRLARDEPINQQKMIGELGINLVYSSFYGRESQETFVDQLVDNMNKKKLEIDYICIEGPAFKKFESRVLAMKVLQKGFAPCVVFSPDGKIQEPSTLFYKKPILVLRGSFRPPTLVTLDMLKCGQESFLKDNSLKEEEVLNIAEITMDNLKTWGDLEEQDFLARVNLLGALGLPVMVSSSERHYRLSTYFNRFTKNPVGIVLGVYNLKEMLNEKHYEDLEGGMLQSFGVLFNNRAKIYVYPYSKADEKKLLLSKDLEIPSELKFLYAHLVENNCIQDLQCPNKDLLHIYSRHVLEKIKNNESEWEEMVPASAVKLIKECKLYGYQSK